MHSPFLLHWVLHLKTRTWSSEEAPLTSKKRQHVGNPGRHECSIDLKCWQMTERYKNMYKGCVWTIDELSVPGLGRFSESHKCERFRPQSRRLKIYRHGSVKLRSGQKPTRFQSFPSLSERERHHSVLNYLKPNCRTFQVKVRVCKFPKTERENLKVAQSHLLLWLD